jgi:hypothetical protein
MISEAKSILTASYIFVHHRSDLNSSVTNTYKVSMYKDFYVAANAFMTIARDKASSLEYYDKVLYYFYKFSYRYLPGQLIRRFYFLPKHERRESFNWFVLERRQVPEKYDEFIPLTIDRLISGIIRKNYYYIFIFMLQVRKFLQYINRNLFIKFCIRKFNFILNYK